MFRFEHLEVETERIADGMILRPVGEIDLTLAPSLRDQIHELQREHPARLVLDLSRVPYVDSSVLATFVEAMQTARRTDGILVLCALQEKVRSILEISRLDGSVFTIVDTTDEAIALPNRRKFKRYGPGELECDLGAILDFSAGGLKLRTTRRLRSPLTLRLQAREEELRLRAEVAWSRRLGFRRHVSGLRFVGLKTEEARALAAIVDRMRAGAPERR